MIYLTYNDQPSGVYFSQVTDVCNYVNQKFDAEIRLVALISVRGFSTNKKAIKRNFSNAVILPMFPKQKNWRKNKIILKFLFLVIGKQNIWSRGIFATNMALELKQKGWVRKVVFDGRGAYEAEYKEYLNKIVHSTNDIFKLEETSINSSDCRIAVSNQLVDYWRKNYDYKLSIHFIIPCTLGNFDEATFPSEMALEEIRKNMGFNKDDIVFIYSGSSADWQSLKWVDDFVLLQMQHNAAIKFILLSNSKSEHLKTYKEFPDRIIQKWVKASEVPDYLLASDYGILIRENSVTNQVASPTKFAEYLNAGLNVLISEHIGDFTEFTRHNKCGTIISDFNIGYNFCRLAYSQKVNNFNLAQKYFTKRIYIDTYKALIEVLRN